MSKDWKFYLWNGEIVVRCPGIYGVVGVDSKFYTEYSNPHHRRTFPPPRSYDADGLKLLTEIEVLGYKLSGRIDLSKVPQEENESR